MNHLGTVVLETERLILRPFKESDAEDMYNNWAGNDKVTKYLTWPTHESSDVTRQLVKFWESNNVDLKNYQWCIEWKENHQAIGSIGFVHMDENIEAGEIGYCIGEDYWNKGVASEAFKKMLSFLFEEAGFNRVFAEHDIKNPNSGKVMMKCGLRYEGTLAEAGKNNMGICDKALYALTRKMYLE